MTRFSMFLFAILLVTAFSTNAQAKGSVNVGDTIPSNLEFQDQTGEVRNFSDLSGQKGIILVFVRSANWCPYCQKQLIEMDESTERFAKWGYNVVSLSYDTMDEMQKFVMTQKPKMTILSDPASQAIKAFGVLNEDIAKGTKAYGIPHPGVYLIDNNKKVQALFFEEGYKDRPAVEDIFKKIEKLNPPRILPMTVETMGTDPIDPEEAYITTPQDVPSVLNDQIDALGEPEKLVSPPISENIPDIKANINDDNDADFKLDIKTTPQSQAAPVARPDSSQDMTEEMLSPVLTETEEAADIIEPNKIIPQIPPKIQAKPAVDNKLESENLTLTTIQEAPSVNDLEDDFLEEGSRDAIIGDDEMQFIE